MGLVEEGFMGRVDGGVGRWRWVVLGREGKGKKIEGRGDGDWGKGSRKESDRDVRREGEKKKELRQ